jgi:hypothetical protein
MANPSADMIQDITTRFILTAPAEQLMCVVVHGAAMCRVRHALQQPCLL